jgi:uncharacterized protein YjiS (DUF1127 family)
MTGNPSPPAILGFIFTAGSAPREANVQSSIANVENGTQPHSAGFFAKLPLIWLERAAFRAKLRADLKDDPDLLRDIGISLHGARAEVVRFFWEPVLLTRR